VRASAIFDESGRESIVTRDARSSSIPVISRWAGQTLATTAKAAITTNGETGTRTGTPRFPVAGRNPCNNAEKSAVWWFLDRRDHQRDGHTLRTTTPTVKEDTDAMPRSPEKWRSFRFLC